jgi:hypothetical protein
MIVVLLALQLVVSAVYYLSAPFHLTWPVVLFWLANSCSVLLLIKHHRELAGPFTQTLKQYRLLFTATLVISEIIINLVSDDYVADNLHGFISDTEVLLTGITLGVLWHYELTKSIKKVL